MNPLDLPIDFLCGRNKFPVIRRKLLELELFTKNFSALNDKEYAIKAPVDSESMRTFVNALDGKEYQINDDNVMDLFALCDELGFGKLNDACKQWCKENSREITSLSYSEHKTIMELEERLYEIERRTETNRDEISNINATLASGKFGDRPIMSSGSMHLSEDAEQRMKKMENMLEQALQTCDDLRKRIEMMEIEHKAERLYRQGIEFVYGIGCTKSTTLGFECIKQSADMGHPDARYRCGDLLVRGTGCTKDVEEARKYSEMGVAQGDIRCLNTCGYCEGELHRNKQQSLDYFKRGAEKGHAAAQCNYGVCMTESSSETDRAEAAANFKKAAEQECSDAYVNYAWCLETGYGVPKDPAMAIHYYKKAADAGVARAQFSYAKALDRGDGVEKDAFLALLYYKMAMDQGVADAEYPYNKLCQSLGFKKKRK